MDGGGEAKPEKNGDENELTLLEAVSSALLTIKLFKKTRACTQRVDSCANVVHTLPSDTREDNDEAKS